MIQIGEKLAICVVGYFDFARYVLVVNAANENEGANAIHSDIFYHQIQKGCYKNDNLCLSVISAEIEFKGSSSRRYFLFLYYYSRRKNERFYKFDVSVCFVSVCGKC